MMRPFDVHGAVCVGSRGLAGHLHELLETCGASAELEWDRLPLFDRVWQRCWEGCRPARTRKNVAWVKQFVELEGLEADAEWASRFELRKGQSALEAEADARMAVLCDPQTSGGMIVVIRNDQADAFEAAFEESIGRPPARIGVVASGEPGEIHVR